MKPAPKRKSTPFGRAVLRVMAALAVALYAVYVYWRETSDFDPYRRTLEFAFADHPEIFVPLCFALLAVGLALAVRQYAMERKFGASLFLVLAAFAALALFAWSHWNA